jgi:hypothetical protein
MDIAEIITVRIHHPLIFSSILNPTQPSSRIYHSHLDHELYVHIRQNPVVFIWETLNHSPVLGARFAISFYVQTAPPFSSINLAHILLQFSSFYTARYHTGFTLLGIAFKLGISSIYGVLLYNEGLRAAYEGVLSRARQHPRWQLPITVWPLHEPNRHLLRQSMLQHILETSQFVLDPFLQNYY